MHPRSVEELRLLLTDAAAYGALLHSLDQVAHHDALRDDLKKGNVDLARQNLERENKVNELRNQCMIIRNTELAAVREQFAEAQRREREVNSRCSPGALLDKLQQSAHEADEESESLHRRLLSSDLDLAQFLPQYRKQRLLFHTRSLTRLAALTSLASPG
eukprot:SM000215S06715  [mRNA]  locus=s215:65521:67310:+ [translate_table: standard]